MRLRYPRHDSGSITPLILGFFVIAFLVVAGSVAAGNASLHQSALQDRCDGAAIGVGASGLKSGRNGEVNGNRFDQSKVEQAITLFIQRDPARKSLVIRSQITPNATSVELSCTQNMPVSLGLLFGRASITHHATSSVSAPVRSS